MSFRRTKAPRKPQTAPYRSQFEARFASTHPNFSYESAKLKYTVPASGHNYTPDFYDPLTGTYYELKGRWTASDRKKMKLVVEQHPDKNIVMVFQDPSKPINKGSKTTYGDWATKNGIKWVTRVEPS